MIDKLLWITLRSSIDEILVLIIAQVQRCLKLLSLEDLIRVSIQRSLIALDNAQVGIWSIICTLHLRPRLWHIILHLHVLWLSGGVSCHVTADRLIVLLSSHRRPELLRKSLRCRISLATIKRLLCVLLHLRCLLVILLLCWHCLITLAVQFYLFIIQKQISLRLLSWLILDYSSKLHKCRVSNRSP